MTRRVLSFSVIAVVLLAAFPAVAAGQYVILGEASNPIGGSLVRTETTVQVGAHPLDRFKMVRIVKPTGPLRGSILFLPSLGVPFTLYEQRDPDNAVGSSIAEFFALRNYDVYGYSPRYEGIPAGTCEAGVLDCSVMAGWDLQSMVDDIAFVRSRIEALHPGTGIVAGGVSLGGILAVAVANAHPDDYDGVFPWEGMLLSLDPAVRALNTGYCAFAEALLAAGIYFDAVGINVFRQVAQFAETAPGGLTPIPLFPPNLTNHQVFVLTLAVPTPGPVSMPVPGYVQMNGSFAEDRLFFASEARAFENIKRFHHYAPNVLVRDVSCALAGLDDTHVANLGDFTGAVLMIGGGRGFGAFMGDQLAAFGSTDKELQLEPEFGHIDHFMTPRHREVVERPIWRWAERVLP